MVIAIYSFLREILSASFSLNQIPPNNTMYYILTIYFVLHFTIFNKKLVLK